MTVQIQLVKSHCIMNMKNMNTFVIRNKQTTSSELTDTERIEGCQPVINSHEDTSCARQHVKILEYMDGKSHHCY